MSRTSDAFKDGKAFIGFVTGGDPSLEATAGFVRAMEEAGCGLIEIGVPFSDPIAEGPVIQAANLRALAAGATVDKLFGLVEGLRGGDSPVKAPLAFLTYLNPVFRYGYEAFFARAAEAGLDALIIPDLPFEEQGEAKPIARRHGIDLISLIAPTSAERAREIAQDADGFVYLVSSMGVTGERSELGAGLKGLVQSAKAASPVPVAVGFGIHSPEQASAIARGAGADGVIVGSAIVRIVERHGALAAPHIAEYVRGMRAAMG